METAVSDAILVGPVTTRRGHRLHLAESGRAHCGAGRGRIRAPPEALKVERALGRGRRCIKAINAAVQAAADTAAYAGGNAYRESDVRDLAALGDALQTPAQRLERAN